MANGNQTLVPSTGRQRLRVVVTGGLGSLGEAVVERLHAGGARIVVVDRAAARACAGAELVIGDTDLGDEAAASAAFERAFECLGGIDALVNVAGGFAWEMLESGSLDTWDRLYAVNLRTAVAACRATLPHLQQGARIVNVGALASLKAGAGMGAYAASKAGVARLTEALAEELKPRHINVNAVLPSIIDTPANRKDMPDADPATWVSPAQLAGVIAFLLGDDAAAITGASIPVAAWV